MSRIGIDAFGGDTIQYLADNKIPRILPKMKSLSLNLNFFTENLPQWLLYHPYLLEWYPELLIFNQQEQGRNSLGEIVRFDNAPSSFEYYYNVFPGMREKYELNDAIGFLSLCGSGLIYMFILPVVSCMLIISSIGMSAGFILLALIFVLMYLSNLFFGYILGNLICKLLKQEYNVYLSGLFGITLITVLSYIPYINVVVNLVSVCSGFGILVKLITDKENRK